MICDRHGDRDFAARLRDRGTAGCGRRGAGGGSARGLHARRREDLSASARCSGGSCCSLMNLMIRLIRTPSLTNPPSSVRSRRRHARVMQRDGLPLVVEHERARGAGLGVGRVVQEPLGDVDDLVLAQRDLLLLAARVLHDRHELADDRLALRFDQLVEAERRELRGRRGDRDEREVALLVGEEEAVGSSGKTCASSGRPSMPSW